MSRPTIAELEEILARNDAAIEILPNGEIRAFDPPSIVAARQPFIDAITGALSCLDGENGALSCLPAGGLRCEELTESAVKILRAAIIP